MFSRKIRPSSRRHSRGFGASRRSARRFAPGLVALETRALLSTITVTNDNDSGPGSLRDALTGPAPGTTIDFAPSAYGTITLTSGPLVAPNVDLTIKGPGAGKLTISGNEKSTVFQLGVQPVRPTSPASMTISGLTIADGMAANNNYDYGGGIFTWVNLTLTDSVLRNNQAPYESGGGLSDAASVPGLHLNINNDLFQDNTAGLASVRNFQGGGGAIDAENGSIVAVSSSTFIDNQSISPQAFGGAISVVNPPTGFSNNGGSLTVTDSTFRGDQATSSPSSGYYGGIGAAGGAIRADPQVDLAIDASRFLSNEATVDAQNGYFGGTAAGGAIEIHPGLTRDTSLSPTTTITNSVILGNIAAGTGNSGTLGEGGAIDSGGVGGFGAGAIITTNGSAFTANQAIGDGTAAGPSEVGGSAQGGAINVGGDALALTADTFTHNKALGGNGTAGVRSALGGAINSTSSYYPQVPAPTTIVDSLFNDNEAIGGTGAASYDTYTQGGALNLQGVTANVTNTRFIGNQAIGSSGGNTASQFPPYYGPQGNGGAIAIGDAALSIQGGLIAGNVAKGGQGAIPTVGPGGNGGYAWGGGIFVYGYVSQPGSLTIDGATVAGNTVAGNTAIGGDGGPGAAGGYGQGGGIYLYYGSTAKIDDATIASNTERGGAGGQGTTPGTAGDAQGGGIFDYGSTLAMDGDLVTLNTAIGGSGGGSGEGGVVFVSGTGANASLTDVLITLNAAIGGSGGGSGFGGGLYIGTGALTMLKHARVFGDFASTDGDDVYGTATSG